MFYNWAPCRFVVFELKIGRFEPEHGGKLGFHVAWVDANLRLPDRQSPTIAILLCAGRGDNVVRYALAGAAAPLAVADYTYDALPPAARAAVPTESALSAAAGSTRTALGTTPQQPRSKARRQRDGTGAVV